VDHLQPEGAAISNYVIQAALGLVLKESFKLYRAINDGIINLVDKVGLVSDLVFGFTTIPFLSNVPKCTL
jgi:hypothetical protein